MVILLFFLEQHQLEFASNLPLFWKHSSRLHMSIFILEMSSRYLLQHYLCSTIYLVHTLYPHIINSFSHKIASKVIAKDLHIRNEGQKYIEAQKLSKCALALFLWLS